MNKSLEVNGEEVYVDDELHHELNSLAGEFYACLGYKASDDFDYYNSQHPQENLMYTQALIAYIFIQNTGFGE